MLKRISFQRDKDPAFLVPPSRAAAGGPSSPKHSPRSSPSTAPIQLPSVSPSSPSYPFPYVPPSAAPFAPVRSLERPVLHKTLASLSALLIALDELRDTTVARARAEKKVYKAVKELASGFSEKVAGSGGKSEVVVEALGGCAGMYETLAELDQKAAKGFEKDYEAVNEVVAKFFKKTAKEEKAYEDALASLDAQIARATAKYQTLSASSTSSRNMHAALDSLTSQHTSYMNLLSNLSAQVQQTKGSYASTIADKREAIAREVARAVCGMAEKEWRHRVESTRKGGKEIGKVVNGGMWCEAGMEEGGVAAFSADVVPDEPPSKSAPTQPAAPTNDFSPSPRQVQSDSVQRNTSLRGPRAPSGSSGLASSTNSHPSHTPSYGSYESSQSGSAPSVRQQAPRAQAAVAPSAPPSPSRQSFDPPPSTRRVSSDERDRPAREDHTPLAQPPRPDDSYSPTSPPPGDLRRPTPRYGSLPPQPSIRSGVDAADEFGMVNGGSAAKGLVREDSFVARMSAKYASATVGETRSGRNEVGDAIRQRENIGGTDRPGHTRTDSRVQQLAKRYSSPPDATYAQPLSPTAPTAPTSPPASTSRRPLPPTHRHSNSLQYPPTSSGTSSQYPSASSGTSESSSLFSAPPPPQTQTNRPQIGSSSSYQTEASQPPSQQSSTGRRPRAYERASPLPSQHQSEFSSSTAAESDQLSGPPSSSSRPTFSSSPQPSFDSRYTSSSANQQPPPQPANFSPSIASSPRPYTDDGETQVGAHTRICACPDCTAAKYGASSGAGGEGVEKDEEERLQRLLRREKEGTLRGFLNKVV